MAEQQQQPQQPNSAPFPTPPPFYKHFTKQNLRQLRKIRKEAGSQSSEVNNGDSEKQDGLDILALPTELRYLLPPPPPADGKYRSFGAHIDLNAPDASLTEAGIEQLYPSDPSVKFNPQPHLLALSRSLLTTFLSLVGILSQNPELYEKKVEDLQTIMYNIHDLINQYRPHQARESLILLMEERIERMRDEMKQIDEAKGKVSKLMQQLRETGEEQGRILQQLGEAKERDGGGLKAGDEKWKQEQRGAWGALDQEMQRPQPQEQEEEQAVISETADAD